ncbi:MAG: hypothetical protein Q8P50_17550, partial [Bacillota bacterium]|nr:hypothetical protein [Bacillota bacterium]
MYYEGYIYTPRRMSGESRHPQYTLELAWSKDLDLLETRYVLRMNTAMPGDLFTDENPDHGETLRTVNPYPGMQIGMLQAVADVMCLAYGKPFYLDGILRCGPSRIYPGAPFHAPIRLPAHSVNSRHRRVDRGLADFAEASASLVYRLIDLVQAGGCKVKAFVAATQFYADGVRRYEADPIESFLAFITALEVLSAHVGVAPQVFVEPEEARLRAVLGTVPDGDKLIDFVNRRIFHVRKRLLALLERFLDKDFYTRHEVDTQLPFAEPEEFRRGFLHA